MNYVIVIPAYNEAEFLPRTIEAIIEQALKPTQLIVVNDGSTDDTGTIIDNFSQHHPWITPVHSYEDKGYSGGAKIIQAFYRGYNAIIATDYDFLVKMDADLLVEPDYFSSIANHFQQHPKLGLAGGMLLTEQEGQWVYENISDRDHVKGAYKAWRKTAFQEMGGLKHTIGWDTLDEILLQYYGWEVLVDESLPVKHYRPLGTKTGLVRVRVRIGYSFYRMRYGFWISLISAAKTAFRNQPYLISGLAIMWGFIEAWWRSDEFAVNEEEGKFVRQFRRSRMLGKLGGKKPSSTTLSEQ
ncbi:MAG: glycosyltransferase family A protein [Bacteroidota bacterium]